MTTMKQLLTDNQMAAIRDVALLGMLTDISIERRRVGAIPAGGDYGDDFLTYTETGESRREVIKGWFYSTPTPVQTVDSGAIVTVNTYRLYVPVGTDILPGDRVHVGPDPTFDYTVSDTTATGTWLPLLTVSLRKRE